MTDINRRQFLRRTVATVIAAVTISLPKNEEIHDWWNDELEPLPDEKLLSIIEQHTLEIERSLLYGIHVKHYSTPFGTLTVKENSFNA